MLVPAEVTFTVSSASALGVTSEETAAARTKQIAGASREPLRDDEMCRGVLPLHLSTVSMLKRATSVVSAVNIQ